MKIKIFIECLMLYFVFSLSSVFMKLASLQQSNKKILLYFCCSILCLAIFSFFWQIILKKIKLSKVYFFKTTTLFWGAILGYLIFKETINIKMIIGLLLNITGIIIVLGDTENV